MKYKRPFLSKSKTDVKLEPLKEWNLTSAYGCYSGDETDPDQGCVGKWQSVKGTIEYTECSNCTFTDKKVENGLCYERSRSAVVPANRLLFDPERDEIARLGQVEA